MYVIILTVNGSETEYQSNNPVHAGQLIASLINVLGEGKVKYNLTLNRIA